MPTDEPGDLHWGTRSRRVLEYLREYVAEHGYPPSIREVGDAVGLTSSSSVAYQLRVLEERGYIRRDPGKPRALTILKPADDAD
jgi:repressor LexA